MAMAGEPANVRALLARKGDTGTPRGQVTPFLSFCFLPCQTLRGLLAVKGAIALEGLVHGSVRWQQLSALGMWRSIPAPKEINNKLREVRRGPRSACDRWNTDASAGARQLLCPWPRDGCLLELPRANVATHGLRKTFGFGTLRADLGAVWHHSGLRSAFPCLFTGRAATLLLDLCSGQNLENTACERGQSSSLA